MSDRLKGAGLAVLGGASGLAGAVIGSAAFAFPFALAVWVADRITSISWLRLPLAGVLVLVFVSFGPPLIISALRPPDGSPEDIAERTIELYRRPVWRRGWLARALALAVMVYAVWMTPRVWSDYVSEASQHIIRSDATLYAHLSTAEMFAGGPVLLATAFLIGSAFTRGAFREIATMVFIGAWALSIGLGILAAKILNPEWSIFWLAVDTGAARTLWAGLFWCVAAWRLRVAYKRAPRPAEQAAAA